MFAHVGLTSVPQGNARQSEAKGRAWYDSKQGCKGRQPGKVTTTGKSKAASKTDRQAGKQDRNTRKPSKAAVQCKKEFESESKCESDAKGKVLRIGHALKVDTDHHRLMEPNRNKQHMLRDAHAKRRDML